MKSCRLCTIELKCQLDCNLINGSGEFRPVDAISQLPFTIVNTSPYVCRTCKAKLKSYVQSKAKTSKLEQELKSICDRSGTAISTITFTSNTNEKSNSLENQLQFKESDSKESQTNLSFPHDASSSSNTVAYVHVCWPSGDRSRKLPPDLTKMAIYLLRTQNKNIAKFALKHPLIRAAIIQLLEKEVRKECQEICRESIKVPADSQNNAQTKPKSRRDLFQSSQKRKADDQNAVAGNAKKFVKRDIRSIFKKTSREDLMNFTFEKANEELEERCPLFWRILKAASRPHNTMDKVNSDVYLSTSIVTAASVCLKNRSQRMITIQLLISLIINHSSYTSTLVRLKTMRLAVSHTYFNKKLDEFGQNHDEAVNQMLDVEKKVLQKKIPVQQPTSVNQQNHENDNQSQMSESSKLIFAKRLSLIEEKPLPDIEIDFSIPVMKNCHQSSPAIQKYPAKIGAAEEITFDTDEIDCKGFKLCFDNVDTHVEVHDMTEEYQNIDTHECAIAFVPNRVTNNVLSADQPQRLLKDLDNANLLCSREEYDLHRDNLLVLVERIITADIKCLQFLKNDTVKHIIHAHSREMAQKCPMTFLDVLPANENDNDGIIDIMKSLQKYQAFAGDDEQREYKEQIVVGDQLSVERGTNAKFQLANGFTPEQGFENMHFEAADFHSEMKFMQLCMDNFYKAGCNDRCTLGSDKVLINRRNVTTEVKKRYAACRNFLEVELESRVLAATLTVLNVQNLDDQPDEVILPSSLKNASKTDKKQFLRKISGTVVDKFVINKDAVIRAVQQKVDLEEELSKIVKTDDGKFRCQEPSCTKVFQYNGKRKKDHEQTAHGIQHAVGSMVSDAPMDNDDMYNYQCSLLEYLMLWRNFTDAISEGDGLRIVRCWKLFLLYLKMDGASSRKYCLEGLYLLFQIKCLLSPREAYRLVWNRSVKRKTGLGGNIPIDLAMEHYIRIVKLLKRKLGPNQTNKHTLQRYMKALSFTKSVLEDFDESTCIIKRSGKHTKKSDATDKTKIVQELMKSNAFTPQTSRKFTVFRDIKPSLLAGFDYHVFYDWIDKHKDDLAKKRKAR